MAKFLRTTGNGLIAKAVIIKELLSSPKTIDELASLAEVHPQTARNFLQALQTVGLLGVALSDKGTRPVYFLQVRRGND